MALIAQPSAGGCQNDRGEFLSEGRAVLCPLLDDGADQWGNQQRRVQALRGNPSILEGRQYAGSGESPPTRRRPAPAIGPASPQLLGEGIARG